MHNICVYINYMQTEYIWSGKVYVHVECKMSCKMS